MMGKIAIVSVILEKPEENQHKLNDAVSSFNGIIKGRMGIPFPEEDIAVISLTVVSDLEEIDKLTAELKAISHVNVKTVVSK